MGLGVVTGPDGGQEVFFEDFEESGCWLVCIQRERFFEGWVLEVGEPERLSFLIFLLEGLHVLNEGIDLVWACGVCDLAGSQEGFDDVFGGGQHIGDHVFALDHGVVDVAVDLCPTLGVDDLCAVGFLVIDGVGGEGEESCDVECEQEEEAVGEFG
ncbi:MAG: hypothetical protein RI897_154 [Verrucomicrobiota bacterium]